jgi:DNA topoisomerase-6 subunit A
MNDVEEYDLWNVTEKLKGKAPDDGGPTKDYKRLLDMQEYPWFKTEKWQEQFDFMTEHQIRVEQQALASKELQFVAEEYLPKKIEEEDYLD